MFVAYHVTTLAETRPVTLKQISERVGVGTSTASVVLNGAKSGTKVSEETRQAILRVAKELNYRPNGLARSLRNRRTGIVGFFSGYEYVDPRNPYIAEVLSGLQSGCARRGLDLLLYTPNAGHTPDEIVANLADGRLDGLVTTARPEHPIAALLAEERLPVVAIADRLPGIPCVVADAALGGRLQARHLHEKGHRRVLYLPSDYPFPSVVERETSFREEAAVLRIEVLTGDPVSGHLAREVIPGAHLRMSDRDAARFLAPDRPTAVVAWDDNPAYQVASQLAGLGLRVGKDVAIVAYNGIVPAVEPRWDLTTVRAPWRSVGETALDALHALIEGVPHPADVVLPVELVVGTTS